ncbi:hypothetical protein CPB83DRAFT_853311 [Crepidotus variabilis]|uniref:Beta-glucuronidase C-terminal domain-containing protein n=1 Tax=Crepidotus variabilis TaxID=179855 RepID=A0A9P6JR33_9AGAR|nr:hypothetical protein CPB83DRAFT_853311 [Crepidotus variabilis]
MLGAIYQRGTRRSARRHQLGLDLHCSFICLTLFIFQTFPCSKAITVYYQNGENPFLPSPTSKGIAYTGLAAYDPTTLIPPSPPGPSAVPTSFALQVANSVPVAASMPQSGSFFGFSIEMSVVNQVLGKNASVIQVPFLNLMANLKQRIGEVRIRVGGNTQDTATLVSTIADGQMLEKDTENSSNPTQTPPLIYTSELLYMLSNISSLVGIRWFLGIPFNDSSNWRLEIAEQGQAILGDYLIGLQGGNEPDLYAAHQHRPANYSYYDYFGEFASLVAAMDANQNIIRQDLLIGPSIQNIWTPEQVWDTGFVDAFSPNLAYLSVERYPTDNCAAKYPGFNFTLNDPQATFPTFLTHQSSTNLVSSYLNSTAYALSKGKQLVMFETNTASCGGFPGISDVFGAALWGVDYALQMAAVNFGGALFHVGGQNVSYNPFTPPPTNQSTYHQWTVGPIYYSALVVAEALGPTNASQVLDLRANNENQFTPAYGIWENGYLARVVLINFVSDGTGASDLNVDLSIPNVAMPTQVQVKYLEAHSVSQKGDIAWANQTFGAFFDSDGRPKGTEAIQTITCSDYSCPIRIPAPGAALVFLSSSMSSSSDSQPDPVSVTAPMTFSTTVVTKLHNTATVDPGVVATSNGHSGQQFSQEPLLSSSWGSAKSAGYKNIVPEAAFTSVVFWVSFLWSARFAMEIITL